MFWAAYSGLTLNQYGVASPCRTGLKLIHYKIHKNDTAEGWCKHRHPAAVF
ncbi:hypothetical protein [Neisseria sicca]|uniref:hypothetical protein n=1 Tax=Neisseria sicca TaxID=490 RepID=UPI000B27D646|nr:hypothetical protein [Neisseria sicca]